MMMDLIVIMRIVYPYDFVLKINRHDLYKETLIDLHPN